MITFIVCLLAGLGAGLGTGFAGMSAAAVISPMLIAFLHNLYLCCKLSGKLYPKHDHGRFFHIYDNVTRY